MGYLTIESENEERVLIFVRRVIEVLAISRAVWYGNYVLCASSSRYDCYDCHDCYNCYESYDYLTAMKSVAYLSSETGQLYQIVYVIQPFLYTTAPAVMRWFVLWATRFTMINTV